MSASTYSDAAHEDEYPVSKPKPQDYWYHDGDSWIPSSSPEAGLSSQAGPTPPRILIDTKRIQLISWNIDILIPFVEERMEAALSYLSTLISSSSPSVPIVVFFQEMGPSDLVQIREQPWIQERFYITDINGRTWTGPQYGTTALIDRRLRVEGVMRVPWYSAFDRDGLFVDIALTPITENGEGGTGKVLRMCNTHLESLVADPPVRPVQMASAAQYLSQEDVAAALLAGDLNAIQPFDRTLHSENGLMDAYLELGGEEDSHNGFTWGYQSPRAAQMRFGPCRMDKILFRGAIKTAEFERVGMGVKVAEDVRQEMREVGSLEWVTDHYGVMGEFELEGWRLGTVVEG